MITSAPRLPRSCVQNGPGRRRVRSTTRTPSRIARIKAANPDRHLNLVRPRRIEEAQRSTVPRLSHSSRSKARFRELSM